MHPLLICTLAFVGIISVVSGDMNCGAFSCPNVANKIGNAITGKDDGKAYCCRTDALSVPYCCDMGEYATYAFGRFSDGNSLKVVSATTIGAVLLAFMFR